MPVVLPRQRMLAGRAPLLPSPVWVSCLLPVPVLSSSFRTLILAPSHFLSWYPDPSSTDREDIDTIIGEVAKDTEAEAAKIAAEEAAKTATEEAAALARGRGAGGQRRPEAAADLNLDLNLKIAGSSSRLLCVIHDPMCKY